ncbi:MAG: hypothetical protein ACK4MR_12870, partial [Erythrobacter cryptus]
MQPLAEARLYGPAETIARGLFHRRTAAPWIRAARPGGADQAVMNCSATIRSSRLWPGSNSKVRSA